jgi:hypothetical protein
MDGDYDRLVPDYDGYRNRRIAVEEQAGEGAIEFVEKDEL